QGAPRSRPTAVAAIFRAQSTQTRVSSSFPDPSGERPSTRATGVRLLQLDLFWGSKLHIGPGREELLDLFGAGNPGQGAQGPTIQCRASIGGGHAFFQTTLGG